MLPIDSHFITPQSPFFNPSFSPSLSPLSLLSLPSQMRETRAESKSKRNYLQTNMGSTSTTKTFKFQSYNASFFTKNLLPWTLSVLLPIAIIHFYLYPLPSFLSDHLQVNTNSISTPSPSPSPPSSSSSQGNFFLS